MMKFVFLTRQFYDDYKKCTEIEQKNIRPYSLVYTKINNVQFAVPLRSEIKHKYSTLQYFEEYIENI
jgi:hypothetical protein